MTHRITNLTLVDFDSITTKPARAGVTYDVVSNAVPVDHRSNRAVLVEAEFFFFFFFFFPSKGLDVPDKHNWLEMKMNRR